MMNILYGMLSLWRNMSSLCAFNLTHIDVDDVSLRMLYIFSLLRERILQFAGFCCCLLISQYDSDLIEDEEKKLLF
jgi:hypothetical protein